MKNIKITVYSNPGCWPCKKTKEQFDKGKVKYVEDNADTDINRHLLTKVLGFTQAPVVLIEEDGHIIDKWSGLRPDKIQTTIKNYGEAHA